MRFILYWKSTETRTHEKMKYLFSFSNKAYFDDDINFYNSIFQNNIKNFEDVMEKYQIRKNS